MMFVGAKFCSHCGASAARAGVAGGEKQLCPRCQAAMSAVMIGSSSLGECQQCQGLWADVATLQQICADREKQAAVLGMPVPPQETVGLEKNIRYVPCPVCHKLMNRLNFAHCSNVIVDVCKAHGTWFDKDELRRMVEFIRAGGLEKSRNQQMAAMQDERRRLEAARHTSLLSSGQESMIFSNHTRLSDAAHALDTVDGMGLVVDLFDLLK
jgi:Zn-finger nucleic acid-binding protein